MNAHYEKFKSSYESYRKKTRLARKAYDRERYLKKRKEFLERAKRWSESNREKSNQIKYAHIRRNRWKYNEFGAARIILKKNATPPWVDFVAIDEIYKKATQVTSETGIVHEVDHIWPLKGDGFVGLHVPWNLRIITRTENRRKINKTPHFQLTGV